MVSYIEPRENARYNVSSTLYFEKVDFDYRLGKPTYHQDMPHQRFPFENDIIRIVVEHGRVNQTTHTVTVSLQISITGFGWVHLPPFTQVARA